MKRSTIGFFLLLMLGALAIGVWKFLAPRFFSKGEVATSDAAKIQVKIVGHLQEELNFYKFKEGCFAESSYAQLYFME